MRLYRTLLYLYPASFRSEYEREMSGIFAQRRREAPGLFARFALYVSALFEILFNAIAVHADMLNQDLQYTARTLARAPGFAVTAIAVLALGIGANTAAFSIADFVLIRPLPFADPDRLVKVWENVPGYGHMEASPANYRDWKHASTAFEAMGAFHSDSVNLVQRGEPRRLDAAQVTADLFPLLGAKPFLGRLFSKEDDREAASGTILLSYGLWQTSFGGDASAIGRSVTLDNASYTVIGVMPTEFHFPNAQSVLWRAERLGEQEYSDRANTYLQVVARLKAGMTLAQAKADMDVVAAQLKAQYPKDNAHTAVNLNSLSDEMSDRTRLLLVALSGAALCVLLIACANLANLLLARAMSRRKEIAVREALGAGRERLVRQLMTESLVLAALGGVAGVMLAVAGVPALNSLVPNALPLAHPPSVDFRVLSFAGLLTIATGIAFAVVPAFRMSGERDFAGLREGTRSGGGRKERLRSMLVVAEVTVSVVLLVSSGLLLKALVKIQATDPGFQPQGVLTLRTVLPQPKYEKTSTRVEFYQRVLAETRALPGVKNAAYISFLPMVMRGGIWPVAVGGKSPEIGESNTASMRFTSPRFFAAMGIPLFEGRDVEEGDTVERQHVGVVSQSFARHYWPHDDAIGRHFTFALHDRVVVGVVRDIRVRGLERESEPQVYLPYRQVEDGWFPFYAPKDLVIQSSAGTEALLTAIREIIHRADPEQPVSDVRSMSEIVESETASRQVQLRVLAAFAGIALLLAGAGIHGLLSFSVSQRAQEIGVRIALGARPDNIVGLILRQGGILALAGVLPGIALAYAAGRWMQALLAGVEPFDAAAFLLAAGVCVLMTLLGCLTPALRAVRVDPIQAIRAE